MKTYSNRSPSSVATALLISLSAVMGTNADAQATLWLGDWYPVLDARIVLDDNVNRSFEGNGEKRDFKFAPTLTLENQIPLAPTSYSYLGAELAGMVHAQYQKYNYVAPGVTAGIRHFLGADVDAALIAVGLRLKYEFHAQDPRFGAEANPRMEFRATLWSDVLAGVYYEYDNRFASENSVYDRQGHTFGLYTDIGLTPDIAVMVGYYYRTGDTLVHQPRSDLGEEIRGERLPVDTFKDRYDAVRLKDADTQSVTVRIRYATGLFTTVTAGYTYERIKADGEQYPSNQVLLGVTYLL